MYTNERRRVAQFCHIRQRQNRDKRLITDLKSPPKSRKYSWHW